MIGAGQAGLAAAWHLAQRGLRFVVLEAADQLGSSWRGRWDSLRLFSPAQYDALPGMAFPAPADTYPGKEAVADFLRDYATRFDLPVQLSKRVTALSRIGDEFEVRTDDEVFRAQQVLVATGPFQSPFTPEVGHGFDGSVTQIHSTDYRNPQSLPPGPVLVVGGGNSGLQIAHELVATRQVDVSVGEKVPMLPQRLLGRDLFWWLTRLGFWLPRSTMSIQPFAIERFSDLAEPLCAQLAPIGELVASFPAPRCDHRQHQDSALAQQVLIDARIVLADLFGCMGKVEFDGPATTRLEVDEQQLVLRGEHVARVWLAMQQLLAAALADHSPQTS